MDDLVDLVERSLTEEALATFTDRVDDQAETLRSAVTDGEYDNDDFAVGMEIEVYAINAEPEPVPEPEEDEDDELAEPADQLEAELADPTDAAELEAEQGEDALESDEDAELEDLDADAPEVVQPEPYMPPEEWEGRLSPLPDSVFGDVVAKELGVHNAEVNTDPDSMDPTGLDVQTASVEMRVKRARDAVGAENREIVLDGMWTIPPEEGAVEYLSAHEDRDGVVVAENMRTDPRYVAIDNDALSSAGGEVDLSLPGIERSFPTILLESLTSSIQPHLQIPSSAAFPSYYNAAIRTMGPVLALTANSPLLPPDVYTDVDDPEALLDDLHHESRIAVFEQSVNTTENPKVRVPNDLETALDVMDYIRGDDTFAPFLREWLEDGDRETRDDEFWEFDHKRGTYWRWLRCVVGGDAVQGAGDEDSIRIEYRPIPTQPSVADCVAAQVLVVGLLRGLVEREHPIADLDWDDAEDCFYDAARNGADADLVWLDADGERTSDPDVIADELFEHARAGLDAAGIAERHVEEYLEPLARRRELTDDRPWLTPSQWKIDRVRENLDDGADFETAVHEMQREYFELSREEDCFADWV